MSELSFASLVLVVVGGVVWCVDVVLFSILLVVEIRTRKGERNSAQLANHSTSMHTYRPVCDDAADGGWSPDGDISTAVGPSNCFYRTIRWKLTIASYIYICMTTKSTSVSLFSVESPMKKLWSVHAINKSVYYWGHHTMLRMRWGEIVFRCCFCTCQCSKSIMWGQRSSRKTRSINCSLGVKFPQQKHQGLTSTMQ